MTGEPPVGLSHYVAPSTARGPQVDTGSHPFVVVRRFFLSSFFASAAGRPSLPPHDVAEGFPPGIAPFIFVVF